MRRNGGVVVFTVVCLFTLMLFAALAIDVGVMYAARAELQRSADAGVLAGAVKMFDESGLTTGKAINLATSFVGINETDVFGIDVQLGVFEDNFFYEIYDKDTNAIQVKVNREVQLFFAPLLGTNTTIVGATAVAGRFYLSETCIVPVALRAPDFGPVDPDIAAQNPGKDGPSYPYNDNNFELGEKVTVFVFGKGPRAPVHLVLDLPQFNGVAETDAILSGKFDEECDLIALGDEIPVWNNGTGNGNFGQKLEDRMQDGNPSNDTIVCPIVETLINSRDDDGKLIGNIKIVDFVAIHLDEIVEVQVPDPNKENKTITVKIITGTIVPKQTNGLITEDPDDTNSIFRVRLLK